MPAIDANEDGRLTVRELRQIAKVLEAFDRGGDGAPIDKAELFPTIRLSFGHGPIVHRQLETVRSVYSRSTTPNARSPHAARMVHADGSQQRFRRYAACEFLGAKERSPRSTPMATA